MVRWLLWALAAPLVTATPLRAQIVDFTIANFTGAELQLFKVQNGREELVRRIEAGHPGSQKAAAGTVWRLRRADGREICGFSPGERMSIISVDAPAPPLSWKIEIESGFKVGYGAALLAHPDTAARARSFIRNRLEEVAKLVPIAALHHLRQVTLWLDRDTSGSSGGFYATWPSNRHIGRDRGYGGFHGAMYQGVVFPNIMQAIDKSYPSQPMMVFHELAHGYHHTVLGTWNPEVKRVYENAKAHGLYRDVSFSNGGRAAIGHALRDEWEYFAELSEAYFGANDQTPRNLDELKSYDSKGLGLVEQAWAGKLDMIAPMKRITCRSPAS